MPARAKFINKAIGKNNIAQAIKSVTRRTSRLETRRGADAGIAAHQSDAIHSEDGVTFVAGPYPLTAILNWFTDDTGAKVARVLGYFVSGDTFSGLELDAIAKTGSTVGDLVLAAFTSTNDIDVDAAPAAIHVRSDGRIISYISGTAIAEIGATGLKIGTGGAAASKYDSGTATPAVTGVTNIDAVSGVTLNWYQLGDNVTVWGIVSSVDPTASGTLTEFRVALPVSSNFASGTDAGGSVYRGDTAAVVGGILADATNDQLLFRIQPNHTNAQAYRFHASYKVI